jgi:nucleoside-diphosphate-sugar epimerase
LVADGHDVRVLDNLSTGSLGNLSGAIGFNRVEIIEGDIRNESACDRACSDVNYIFHLAAVSSVPSSIESPTYTHDVNATGTLNMLLAARRNMVEKFVFASSAAIYGNTVLRNVETQPPDPLSPYALSKLMGEHYCKLFIRLYGLQTVSLRYFNVFGPRQNRMSEYAAVIPKFINRALNGEGVEVFGDGEQSRDFTYVNDVVEANILAMSKEGISGEVFNVARGIGTTINELVEILMKKLGLQAVKYLPAREGDIRHSVADISKAQERLSYQPHGRFEEDLENSIEYYKKFL